MPNFREEILQRAKCLDRIAPSSKPTVFEFGKHQGSTAKDVLDKDPGYLVWAWRTVNRDRLPFTKTLYEKAHDLVRDRDYMRYSGDEDMMDLMDDPLEQWARNEAWGD